MNNLFYEIYMYRIFIDFVMIYRKGFMFRNVMLYFE